MPAWNSTVLLLAGLVLGLALGATYGFAWASPECAFIAKAEASVTALAANCLEFWVARYQALIAGFLALVGAALTVLAIFRQIRSSEAQNRSTLRSMYERDMATWRKTDGSLAELADDRLGMLVNRLGLLTNGHPNDANVLASGYQLAPNQDISIPNRALDLITAPEHTDTRILGASPSVAAEFKTLVDSLAWAENSRHAVISGRSQYAIMFSPEGAIGASSHAVANFMIALHQAVAAARRVVEEAEYTEPNEPRDVSA